MKIYLKIKSIVSVVSLAVLLNSCDEYFMTPIMQTLTQDSIFNSMYNAEKALNSAYFLVPYKWPSSWDTGQNGYRNDPALHQDISAAITDEAITSTDWSGAVKRYYNGTLSPLNVGVKTTADNKRFLEQIFEEPYFYFRLAYIFLENADKVPNASPTWLAETKGQANLLIAIGYYELLKRYGSVPKVDKVLNADDILDETRPPLKDMFEWVDGLIVNAIAGLPETYDANNQGRVTKAAAYFLRSRLWLLAASPLFNTDQPYLPFEKPELICMGSSTDEAKKALWKKAADVSIEAIQYCESKGYRLVNTGRPIEDYRLATRDITGNTELILFSRRIAKGSISKDSNTFPGRHLPPRSDAQVGQSALTAITQNFVDFYRTTDGSVPNYNSANPWLKVEPRFHASVVRDCAYFGGVKILLGEGDPTTRLKGWATGYTLRKFLHEEMFVNTRLQVDNPYPYMRLPELYLNYAEALNEYNPGNGDIQTYLNKTVIRGGLSEISLAGKDQETVRQEIRREKTVEMAFEDQRLFDVKRWKIPATTIGADKYGVKRNVVGTDTTFIRTRCSQSKQQIWDDKFYLMPFPQYEIIKFKGLVQNPGY